MREIARVNQVGSPPPQRQHFHPEVLATSTRREAGRERRAGRERQCHEKRRLPTEWEPLMVYRGMDRLVRNLPKTDQREVTVTRGRQRGVPVEMKEAVSGN